MAERRVAWQTFATAATAAQARQLGRNRRFINKYKTGGLKPHTGLAMFDPLASPLLDVSACALRGHQGFFYM
jgi:hypothetical protein